MSTVIHVAHAMLAGIWLGGMVFTTAVVSPVGQLSGIASTETSL